MDIQTGQVVRPVSATETMERQLSCPICLDMFTKPVVILPCQHNLCRGCANDLYESRNPYRYSGGTFRCPTCRFEVVLDRHGVFGLQRNLLVENIIDLYKQQQEKGGDQETAPLKDADAKEPRCAEHEDERINIFCLTCQAPTCSLCKVFGAHRECEVSPLHAVYQSQKGELRAAVELLATANACVQATMAQMDDACTRIQENGERQRRRLGESFDLLFALLEERKGALLERVGAEERDKVAALRALAETYKEQLQAGVELHERLTRSAATSGAAEFLLAAARLQEEARRAASGAAALPRPEPGYESMEHLGVDTGHAQALINAMDFTRGGEQGARDADRD